MNREPWTFLLAWSPRRFLLAMLAIVFLAEAGVMLVLPALVPSGVQVWAEAIADASLLSLILAPILWWIVVRPLRRMALSEQAKSAVILSATADALIAINEQSLIATFNSAAEKMFGYRAAEVIGRNVSLLAPSPYREEHDRYVQRYLQTGEARIIGRQREVEGQRKDGTRFPLELRVTETRYAGERWFIGTLRDITDRKRAEEALREAELRFRSLVQSATNAIILADGRGNIISWNNGAQTAFGYREEEVTGKPLTLLMPERYRDAHRHGLERFGTTGESRVIGKTVELAGLRKNGSEFPVELSLASWKTRAGTFYGGIIRDISERKRAEIELQSVKETTEAANRDLLAVNEVQQALFRCRSAAEVAGTLTDVLVRRFGAYFARVWLKRPGDVCAECALAEHCPKKVECLHLISSSGYYTHVDGPHRRVPLGAFKIG